MVLNRVLGASIALSLSIGCGSDDGGGRDASGGVDGPADSDGPADGDGSSGDGLEDANAGGAVRSAGCGQAPEFQSGTHTLEVDGLSRTFIVDLPSGYAPSEPYPVVFGFHGRHFSGAEFRSPAYGDLLSAAGDDAIVVHPDAAGEERAWETESQQDVVFFDAMLDALTEGLCVDEARVFAAGHSAGGYFTNVLGCERGDVLRAIAPVAGGGPFGRTGGAPRCERPVSAWIAHSEDDETVLFSNGEGTLDHWLGSGDCDAESFQPVSPDPCVAYRGCATGLAVRWCVYDGGHDWPPFAADGIWGFFQSF